MTHTKLLAAALALVVAAALATPVAAATLLEATPNDADATATHEAVASVGPDDDSNSWNGIDISYQNTSQNGDVKHVEESDVVKIGIDREGDDPGTTIDVSTAEDVSGVKTSNNGETLSIRLGGVYNLQKGDEVVVVYEDARNPAAGEYVIGFTVNPQSGGSTSSATMTIAEDDGGTPTATDDSDDATPTDDGGDATPTDSGDATPTPTPTRDDGSGASGGDAGATGDDGTATPTDEPRRANDTTTDATGDAADGSGAEGTETTSGTDDGAANGTAADGADADAVEDDAGTDADGPGFGALVALVALLGALQLVRR